MGDDYKKQGLFQRFTYARADGKPLDEGERLYTLRYDKDDAWGDACRATLRDFAKRIEALGYKPLAQELREQIGEVEARVLASRERNLHAPLAAVPEI